MAHAAFFVQDSDVPRAGLDCFRIVFSSYELCCLSVELCPLAGDSSLFPSPPPIETWTGKTFTEMKRRKHSKYSMLKPLWPVFGSNTSASPMNERADEYTHCVTYICGPTSLTRFGCNAVDSSERPSPTADFASLRKRSSGAAQSRRAPAWSSTWANTKVIGRRNGTPGTDPTLHLFSVTNSQPQRGICGPLSQSFWPTTKINDL